MRLLISNLYPFQIDNHFHCQAHSPSPAVRSPPDSPFFGSSFARIRIVRGFLAWWGPCGTAHWVLGLATTSAKWQAWGCEVTKQSQRKAKKGRSSSITNPDLVVTALAEAFDIRQVANRTGD